MAKYDDPVMEEVLKLVKQRLKGELKQVAYDEGVSYGTVRKVVTMQKRSKRIFDALVERAQIKTDELVAIASYMNKPNAFNHVR